MTINRFCRENGLPQAVADAWRARGVSAWTPLQEAAWSAGVQAGDEPWLVAGPTSAGKGMLAEAAAACCLARGRKVLWLAPTRALAAAVARQLAQGLAGLGARVRCSTRDTVAEDAQIYRNQFDVLVAVYEKASAWLARQPHGLAQAGLVVADELAMLRDPERGARLDVLLTLIQLSPYAPPRLGLATPESDLAALSRWWGGRLLIRRDRPRPLHEGVLNLETGIFHYLNRSDSSTGSTLSTASTESIAKPNEIKSWLKRAGRELDDPGWPPLRNATAAVAAALAARDEPTLLFASTRAQARAWADGLAEAFSLPAPSPDWAAQARALARREPAWDHRLLARCLERGVGLHHADLSAEGRRLAEEAFRAGAVKLLVATPTLAQGVNLAAQNVVHWPERPEMTDASGPRAVALERWRFADQGGRAGRLGQGEGPGRSILAAWDAPGAEVLWRQYIAGEPEPVSSSLAEAGLAPALLTCLAGDVARTRENLRVFFASTFAGATAWGNSCSGVPALAGIPPKGGTPKLDQKLAQAVDACRAASLVHENERGLRLTGAGQICAAGGLDPQTAMRIADCGLRIADNQQSSISNPQFPCEPPLPDLCLLALCAPPGWWPCGARPGRSPVAAQLRRWFAERETPLPEPLARVLDRPGGPVAGELAAFEAAWRLAEWIGPEPTEEVERRTGWPGGALARAGEGLAWIASGAAALTLAHGGPAEAAQAWHILANRLAEGVCAEGAALAALRVEGLGRRAIQALCREGLGEVPMVAETPFRKLVQSIGDHETARRLRQAARKMRIADCGLRNPDNFQSSISNHQSSIPNQQSSIPNQQSAISNHQSSTPLPALEIDLQSPGVVRAGGREIRLTPLSFDLLAALAENPGRVLTRQAIYQRLWPEGGPEDQQLDAHRRRLDGELSSALGATRPGLIEIIRGVGFRLNLPPPRVQFVRG